MKASSWLILISFLLIGIACWFLWPAPFEKKDPAGLDLPNSQTSLGNQPTSLPHQRNQKEELPRTTGGLGTGRNATESVAPQRLGSGQNPFSPTQPSQPAPQDPAEVPDTNLMNNVQPGTVVEFLTEVKFDTGTERKIYRDGKLVLEQISGSTDPNLDRDRYWDPNTRVALYEDIPETTCEFIMKPSQPRAVIKAGQRTIVKEKQTYHNRSGEGIYIRLAQPFPIHTIMCERKVRDEFSLTLGDLRQSTGHLFRLLRK